MAFISVEHLLQYDLEQQFNANVELEFKYCLLLETAYPWISESEVYAFIEGDDQTFEYSLMPFVEFFKTFYRSVNAFGYNLRSEVQEVELIHAYNILQKDPIEKSQTLHYHLMYSDSQISPTIPTTITQYYVQIFLDGEDVTSFVSNCSINYAKGNFTGECTIKFADPSFYRRIDCADMATNYERERIEVKTRITGQPDWEVQGRFFIEKRDTSLSADGGVEPTCWGRTRTAKLDRPYAKTISKTWEAVTYAKDVAREIINGTAPDIVLRWEVLNYKIYQYRLSLSGATPIEALSQLASPLGAVVSTSKAGELIVHYQWVNE